VTPGPFKARLFPRTPDRWHRVEREGAHETESPVALVKDPEDAIAFAALHEIRQALEEIAEGRGAFSREPLKHAENVTAESKDLARKALAAMKGERR
jgi:hypothetical protein